MVKFREFGVTPAMDDGGLVEFQIAEVVLSLGLGGRSGGEEGADRFFRRETDEWQAGFERVGGDGRDVLPALDHVRGELQGVAIGAVRVVVGELVLENCEGQIPKVGLSSADPAEESVAKCLTV